MGAKLSKCRFRAQQILIAELISRIISEATKYDEIRERAIAITNNLNDENSKMNHRWNDDFPKMSNSKLLLKPL